MFPVNYILFLQIIIFLFITPGTPRIVIISYSMNYGIQKCIWTALGDVSANIVQATLVIFVLGSFFVDNPNFLNIFKWIGIAYLFYLAYDVYKTQPKDPTTKNIITKSFFSFFKDGFLVAGTSPKAWAFFPLIFPQFIDFNSNYIFQFFILRKFLSKMVTGKFFLILKSIENKQSVQNGFFDILKFLFNFKITK